MSDIEKVISFPCRFDENESLIVTIEPERPEILNFETYNCVNSRCCIALAKSDVEALRDKLNDVLEQMK